MYIYIYVYVHMYTYIYMYIYLYSHRKTYSGCSNGSSSGAPTSPVGSAQLLRKCLCGNIISLKKIKYWRYDFPYEIHRSFGSGRLDPSSNLQLFNFSFFPFLSFFLSSFLSFLPNLLPLRAVVYLRPLPCLRIPWVW